MIHDLLSLYWHLTLTSDIKQAATHCHNQSVSSNNLYHHVGKPESTRHATLRRGSNDDCKPDIFVQPRKI